jgi:NADPH-dependent glutamate synthase beta subunit-like oxidoreductase/NAD(P)H-flavin reductase
MDTASPHDLAFGLSFADLWDDAALPRLDDLFFTHLEAADASLAEALRGARTNPQALRGKAEADLLLALSPHLETFLAGLFHIEAEVAEASRRHRALDDLYVCKRLFVQRRAAKTYPAAQAAAFDGEALAEALAERFGGAFDQFAFARHVMAWLADEATHAADLDLAARYAAWAVWSEAGRARHRADVLFRVPEKIDVAALVPAETVERYGVPMFEWRRDRLERRDGFALTDGGTDLVGALDEANYCIFCHHQGRDSCSKGYRDKKTGAFAENALGVKIPGCPLEEKISEMHEAKSSGLVLSPLAIACVDNPMVAATGHRICNDCMKACIYQKQQPVNIPQVETRMLKDVLGLPWGFEIYALLTRWNPLNLRRPLPRPPSGYKVLVVGLGPAGFALSHLLMNEGHTVVAIDGAKIEPLPAEISGVTQTGERVPFRPLRHIGEIAEDLDDRVMAGFGGVAEYGITVRWDKNFLKIIRLLLERRRRFAMFGGVRFGSQITSRTAAELGFDHIALCLGAGRPTLLGIPGELARGVRQASDFLMALQLTGAAKRDSVANLQLRMPIVVIGGGLTAIDTATEAAAYYVRQVEKFSERYDVLVAERGEQAVEQGWSEEDRAIAAEYLAHGRAVRAARRAANAEGREPNFAPLIEAWGGSTIAYRRRLVDAPSYTLNHEEVIKALEQGVRFAPLLAPREVIVDRHRHVEAIVLTRMRVGDNGRLEATDEVVRLPARSVLVAAGTQPNTVLAREWPGFAPLDGKYFQAVDASGRQVVPERSAKPAEPHVLMQGGDEGPPMSFFGDLHPSFAGNVVKALASARAGYAVVDRSLRARLPTAADAETLIARLNDELRARVATVRPLTGQATEIVVRAPAAARAYAAGQFFRLQNYEANAPHAAGTTLAMEAVALTGAAIDREQGLVSLIALDMGGSTRLVGQLRPGEPVILMGPTGMASHIVPGETVLLAGGGVGNAELLSTKTAIRAAGGRVVFFAAYRKIADRFHPRLIEDDADVVIWCCEEPPGLEPRRPQDRAFVGNIVEAMVAYAEGRLGTVAVDLRDVDRILCVGSDGMMAAVARARHGPLKPFLKPHHVAIGSINSPMQCMMKEICAQCLQPNIDPTTGVRSVVFSCFCQDQPLDHVDFAALRDRLGTNGLQEKLTRLWIDRCLAELRQHAD